MRTVKAMVTRISRSEIARLLKVGMKRCPRCERVKPLEEFGRMRSSPNGYYGYCLNCTKEKSQRWRDVNPRSWLRYGRSTSKQRWRVEKRKTDPLFRHRETLHKHGMTRAQYERLLDAQAGGCAICYRPPNEQGSERLQVLHVDHDHKTGEIRGLLCDLCNKGLGAFHDDPARLHAASIYLRTWRYAMAGPTFVPGELEEETEDEGRN